MAVYRQRNFCVTVKMSSKRVIGTETCNSENMQGYYLGDGATYAYRDNREYHDIFPAWNWRRLPGLTAPQGERKLVPNRKAQNRETFVGGVSDGKEGAAAMVYARDGLRARKAWFFCGPSVVCLGAGISYKGSEQVLTGVEQRLLKGVVAVSTKGTPQKFKGQSRMEGVRWVHHDNAGYFFPEAANVTIFAGTRKGTWKSIASKYSTKPVSCDVFELCVDHGKSPKDSSYAWITVPVVRLSQMNGLAVRLPKIISNTAALQAIEAGPTVQAVFYDKGRLDLKGGRSIELDSPCILMLRGTSLSIADPAQKVDKIAVTISGRDKKTIPLPRGGNAGSTVTVKLNP
jgi:chondroitin AC lyase